MPEKNYGNFKARLHTVELQKKNISTKTKDIYRARKVDHKVSRKSEIASFDLILAFLVNILTEYLEYDFKPCLSKIWFIMFIKIKTGNLKLLHNTKNGNGFRKARLGAVKTKKLKKSGVCWINCYKEARLNTGKKIFKFGLSTGNNLTKI